jgi:NitT/TauT family transport system permease protein
MLKSKNFFKTALSVLFWVLVWGIGARVGNKNLLIPIPTASDTLKTLFVMLQKSEIYISVFYSLTRIVLGFLSALIVGCICALLTAKVKFFKVLFSPLLKIIRAVPVASFIILVFYWMSKDATPTFIAFLTVLPIIWANCEEGILATDKNLLEMAKVMGLTKTKTLKEIVIPSALPFLSSAASTGLGFAWKSGVAAEVICRSSNSLGNMLWAGKSAVEYAEVFAVTLVIVLLSFAFEQGTSLLLKRGKKL